MNGNGHVFSLRFWGWLGLKERSATLGNRSDENDALRQEAKVKIPKIHPRQVYKRLRGSTTLFNLITIMLWLVWSLDWNIQIG